ncbi:MAG: single-stranded DNA-binding protein [Planctomycetes bacterium]|nr:single-stranded DNA-binding protein [Planctomycetota bacterium]
MANFNRVILMGNLTRDPQLKYLPSNTAVCEFGLAVNRRWRDRDGNQRDETCFVDLAAFGKQGETINQYMSKGRAILVEGRLKFDSWTGQDGTKRSKLSVVVDNFTFVGSRDASASGGAPASGGEGYEHAPVPPGAPMTPRANPMDMPPAGDPPPSGENIPF